MVFYVSGERDNSMKANHSGAIEDQDNEVLESDENSES